MSSVYATDSFAVGVAGGTVWVEAGEAYDLGSAVVKAQPEMFTSAAPEQEPAEVKRPRRGRRG